MSEQRKRIKVSILDDNKLYRLGLKNLVLEDERISLLGEFDNSFDFLNSLKSPFKPDVCLLDIKLPGELTGLACGKRVRDIDPNIQLIFMTAHPEQDTLYEAKQMEASYIEKGTIGEMIINTIILRADYREQLVSLQHDIEKKFSNSSIHFLKEFEQSQNKIAELTNMQRDIMRLRKEDKTIVEIARLLNLNPNTISSHIERAKKKLHIPDPLKFLDLE